MSHITRLGGKTHTDVIAIADVDRMRMMTDPQGAAFGLHSKKKAA